MTDIRRAITDEPPSLADLCTDLDITRYAQVPPRLYTDHPEPKIRTWNEAKAEANLTEISWICAGADYVEFDFEKLVRAVLRYPFKPRYRDKVDWAVKNWTGCATWFKSHFPDAILCDWNLTQGQEPRQFDLVEALSIRYLDAFCISAYHKPIHSHYEQKRRVLEHHRSLCDEYNKKLVVSIWDRVKVVVEEDEFVYMPLDDGALEEMLLLAISGDIDVDLAYCWSNTFRLLEANNPAKQLYEMEYGSDDPLPEITANMGRVLSAFRLRAEAVK